MQYYSTNKRSEPANLSRAVLKGLAEDGGLYMPERIPLLSNEFISNLHGMGLHEIGKEVISAFLSDEVPHNVLSDMVVDTLNFDIPLVEVEDGIFSLELYHGPTMAFKDVGARFMSRLMAYLHNESNQQQNEAGHGGSQPAATANQRALKVVVATSGDTGSAVAAGFFDVPGIEVYVLFPKGKVSGLQQKQITTWGKNINAIEVDGTFDDCQRLAKQVLGDKEINQHSLLTSANSINIARLIPQSIYYFFAASQVKYPKLPLVFSVPSGNFGNLTAGLLAARMGLPVKQFIAATNINDVVPEYASTGIYQSRKSQQTISNAMDVGDPSNFARMMDLFDHSHYDFCESVFTCTFSDEQTLNIIKQVFHRTSYLMDPHGAVAYMGAKQYVSMYQNPTNMVFLETAHPAKFSTAIEPLLGKIPLPAQLQMVADKNEQYVAIPNKLDALKAILV